MSYIKMDSDFKTEEQIQQETQHYVIKLAIQDEIDNTDDQDYKDMLMYHLSVIESIEWKEQQKRGNK